MLISSVISIKMPQFTHHDFYLNFTASIKAGDLDMTTDIFANEISDFIVFDTDKIIKALNKSDISIDKSCTDEEIVDSVVKNISGNKKLPTAIAFIIAEGNELLHDGDKSKHLKTISTIADGLTKVGNEINKNSAAFKSNAMSQVVSKSEKRKEYNRTIWNKDKKGISIGSVLLISGAVIGLAIVIIYYRQKDAVSKSIPNMIMGGDVSQQINPPVIPVQNPVPMDKPIELAPEPIVSPPAVQPTI